jgi:antitoxin HicB
LNLKGMTTQMLDSYLAKFQKDGDGLLVSFPDVPEAITGGETRDEAFANAQEALELALLTYAADGRAIPTASKRSTAPGQTIWVPVPAAVVAKIAFIGAFRESGMTRVALAKKMGKAETEIRRMLDPYHQTKLPAIEAGLGALGKRLIVSVAEAA